MEIDAGQKLSVMVGDEWMSGTFICHLEEFGQDWLIIDTGNGAPRRINSGYISDIQLHPVGDLLQFTQKPKLQKIGG